MDPIEGKDCISSERNRIDRIFLDSRDDVCTVLTKERLCADSGNSGRAHLLQVAIVFHLG